jgi:uncharacterized membrane protein
MAAAAGEVDSAGFRLRGTDVSRLEGLSDGVFALAMTLLIVSVEVPKSFDALKGVVVALPAFAACFAVLMWFWSMHYVFCRRYGLQDSTTIVLNSCLLFVVLFYVYPLKFLFTLLVGEITAAITGGPPTGMAMRADQAALLFVIYGVGFAGVAAVFLLLNLHALRQRVALRLSEAEVIQTRESAAKCIGLMVVAGASMTASQLVPPQWIAISGVIYCLTGVTEGQLSKIYGDRVRRAQAAERAAAPVPEEVGAVG